MDEGKGLLLALLAIVLIAGSCAATSCEKVNVGNVGLKINTLGNIRGVEDAPTVSGIVWYNPITTNVVEFPTTLQTVVWQKSDTVDESVNFTSKEGLNVNADISFSYQVEYTLAPKFYVKYRQADLEAFAHGYLRNQVRDAFNDEGSRMAIQDIYGVKKGELLAKTKDHIAKKLKEDGIVVSQLTFNSALRLPAEVQKAIDASITQMQAAQTAQNKVAMMEAEARQKVAIANGDRDATKAKADGIAYAITTQAEATAKANEMMQKSLEGNSKLIPYELAKKWNGVIPVQVGSGANSIIDLRSLQTAAQ